jgi:hypothetical protein
MSCCNFFNMKRKNSPVKTFWEAIIHHTYLKPIKWAIETSQLTFLSDM